MTDNLNLTLKQRDAILEFISRKQEENLLYAHVVEDFLNENTAEYGEADHYLRGCDCESCETIRKGWEQA